MAISDPFVVTLGGSGGTAYNLIKIKQDGYNSEYRLRTAGLDELDVTVRHTVESPAAGQLPLERHSIQVKQTINGVDDAPDTIRYVQCTLRCNKSDDLSDIQDLFLALAYVMDSTLAADLVGWDS